MSRDFLAQVIRSQGGHPHPDIGNHLEQSLVHFFMAAESSA
jgi:hypothetical protein